MTYVGDFRVGKTVRKMWNSNAVAGESITRATNGTISVYKNGGTTQSTAGVTDTEDFDGLTGVHLVAIDTSADGTFYAAGSDFEVVLSAATIDGKVINATLFAFSIEARSALMPTTDGRKLDVSAGGEADANLTHVNGAAQTATLDTIKAETATIVTDTNELQTDWTNGGRLDLLIDAVKAVTDALVNPATIADAVHDEVVDGVRTLRELTRGFASVLLGKVSGMNTNSPVFRNIADTKNVVSATTDADGNRSAATLDLT